MAKFRNIVIFISIMAIFVLIYIFFIKSPSANQPSLLSSSTNTTTLPNVNGTPVAVNVDKNGAPALATKDFLVLLLNVKNIKLDLDIFSDPAFDSLHDSSIILEPDGTEGRPNPFAKFGNDSVSASANPTPVVNPPVTNPPTIPPKP